MENTFTPGRSDGYLSDQEASEIENSIGFDFEPQLAPAIITPEVFLEGMKVIAASIAAIRNPAPVVNVAPELSMPQYDEIRETSVIRDDSGPTTVMGPKVSGTRTVIRRTPKT